MAYDRDKSYGNMHVKQPGGAATRAVARKDAVAPCRTGPAKPGGNPPRRGMIPNNEK